MSSNLDSLKIEDIDNKRILNIDLEEEEQVFDDAESEKKDEPEVSPEMKKIDEIETLKLPIESFTRFYKS